jgi:hypothetical protein
MRCFWLMRRLHGRWLRCGRTLSPQLALAWFRAGDDRLVGDENHGVFDEAELSQLCLAACGV